MISHFSEACHLDNDNSVNRRVVIKYKWYCGLWIKYGLSFALV